MKVSQFLLATVKETPNDAELISHKLMIRSGMIRKLTAGIYTWLPLGLKVLRKVENIVREEMDRADALELLMPAIQPAELWQESGRWQAYGPELLRLHDRHEREFCFGPTHEEVLTDIMRKQLKSYKQLPMNCYQIQTKFRDEIRPRFGIMRGREFLMKDAYSFHIDEKSLAETYDRMYQAYCEIFNRIGLDYRPVLADTGSIGGNLSHEFQVLADSGEDLIAYSNESNFAANVELAEVVVNDTRPAAGDPMTVVDTPKQRTIDDVVKFLNMDIKQTVKTLLVKGTESPLVALIVRGDHSLNSFKAEKHPAIASPLELGSDAEIAKVIGCDPGSIGPVNLNVPIIVDRSAASIANFCCGFNENDKHYINVNWERDLPLPEVFDLREIEAGDPSPDGKGTIQLRRGIEVGHIFQLGDKYSKVMNATVLNENGKAVTLQMGCYGIGVSRIVAACIEQNHDDFGIIWPDAIAPFDISLIPISMNKSERLRKAATALYEELQTLGYSVLFDDRNERPGVLFSDHDLLGIPHRVVLSDKLLDNDEVEYKRRKEINKQILPKAELLATLERR